MANKDRPRGFWPIRHLSGGEIRVGEYTVTTGQTIYKGDLVMITAAGTVQSATAGAGTVVIGVAAEYVDDSGGAGGKKILVYDDPNIVFGVQCDTGTAPSAADIGATADHVATVGDSTTKQSRHELDASTIGGAGNDQLKIIGIVEQIDNSWGEHVDVEVLINEHHYKAAVAGV